MQQLKEIVIFLKRELKSIFGGWDLEKVEIQNSGKFAGKGFLLAIEFFYVEEKKQRDFLD